ncbi:SRPBCC family protein [Nocardia salmonicida]|uniref:SRPBCC family protein n=1 Tax=Nocardia salmonicida TaxID=53431 RepID=UPI0033D28104
MIENIHERTIDAPAAQVGELIDKVAVAGNSLWPSPAWPPLELDGPLAAGAAGGHGSVPYTCTAYRPGEFVEFTFAPGFMLDGTHVFEVIDNGAASSLRHVIRAETRGLSGLLGWHLAVRPLHDALLEELLDNAETAVGTPPEPYRRPVRARLLYWVSLRLGLD